MDHKITIPLSEYRLEAMHDVVHRDKKLDWVFKLDGVGDVTIEFIAEEDIEF